MKKCLSRCIILVTMLCAFTGASYCVYAAQNGHVDSNYDYTWGGDEYNQQFTPTRTKYEKSPTYLNITSFKDKDKDDRLNVQVYLASYYPCKNSPTTIINNTGKYYLTSSAFQDNGNKPIDITIRSTSNKFHLFTTWQAHGVWSPDSY